MHRHRQREWPSLPETARQVHRGIFLDKTRRRGSRLWLSLYRMAEETGLAFNSLKQLCGSGVERDSVLALGEWVERLLGSFAALRNRKLAAEAEMREIAAAWMKKEIVGVDTAVRLTEEVLARLATIIEAMPEKGASRCNPADPALAHEALTQLTAEMRDAIRVNVREALHAMSEHDGPPKPKLD